MDKHILRCDSVVCDDGYINHSSHFPLLLGADIGVSLFNYFVNCYFRRLTSKLQQKLIMAMVLKDQTKHYQPKLIFAFKYFIQNNVN
jgi:hypothetical protein